MIKFIYSLMFVVLLAACSNCKEPAKVDLKPGMKVVAAWQGNSWWIAKVESVEGDTVALIYSDNSKGTQSKAQVLPHPSVQYINDKPCCFKPGDKVVAKWKNDNWWVATIDKVDKAMANVTYSDGEKGIQSTMDIVRYQP